MKWVKLHLWSNKNLFYCQRNAVRRIEARAKERNYPDIINGQRRRRIAAGAGTTVQEVNKFMKQYNDTKMMMKKVLGNKSMMTRMVRNIAKKSNLDMKDLNLD